MVRRLLISTLLSAVSLTQLDVAAAQSATSPTYPRLGAALISAPQDYDNATYAAQIAKLNFVVLSVWPDWSGCCGKTLQETITAIKAQNPNEVVVLYQDVNEMKNPPTSVWNPIFSQLASNRWWLYQSGSSGSMVPSSFGGGNYEINTTAYAPKNSAGQTYMDWRAAFDIATYIKSTPAADGFFTDNVFWEPRVNGDWQQNGTTDTDTNATVSQWYRQGYVRFFNDLKAGMPGKYQTGNIADWGKPSAVITEYNQVLQGGVMEGMIGFSWSFETQGWSQMMAAYQKTMAAIASPQLVVFHQDGQASDYQGMRYGLGSALLGNAYFWYSENGVYSGVNWFDEFNANLGQATSSPFPSAAYQKGVYRRDFQNGIVLVNPKGNGSQTITLDTSYKHLSGTQDSAVNNGQTVTSVTLNDRDGVILMRLTAQAVPQAPTLSVE